MAYQPSPTRSPLWSDQGAEPTCQRRAQVTVVARCLSGVLQSGVEHPGERVLLK
ncbi:hypothetical protein [Ornithinimicrobium kibberense]|uniref:hypothetical protein n=1 Tax=Ornithinimicrobium kibberense TaxID=282060 RepID=UPI00361B47BD